MTALAFLAGFFLALASIVLLTWCEAEDVGR
jgi:hypothetical protein